MKKIRVFGHTEVTVSIVVEVKDGAKITEGEIFKLAKKKFCGVKSFFGNGGDDKLIGVEGDTETIAADNEIIFDDCMEE